MTASRRTLLALCTAAATQIQSKDAAVAAFVVASSNRQSRCHRSFSAQCKKNHLTSNKDEFVDEVTAFLKESKLQWRNFTNHDLKSLGADDRKILAVGTETSDHVDASTSQPFSFLLHLCPTPNSNTTAIEGDKVALFAWRNAHLTNVFATNNHTIVHLHEDVWNRSPEIVQSRLRSKCGLHNKRIYARQTIVKRIPKAEYNPFLDKNHLWGATGAKYAYGLYTKISAKEKESKLVAVATFSNKRKIKRASSDFHSYELLRFCTEMDCTVVGGLSKLIAAFVKEIARTKVEDCEVKTGIDIVTSIDRDFGTNSWPNFECMDVMNPLPMFVGTDGIRRQAVGVGLTPLNNGEDLVNDMSPSMLLRVGLPLQLTDELEQCNSDNEAAHSCWNVANEYGFQPVFDAGVERLVLIVDEGSCNNLKPETLWNASTPKFVTDHYSPNVGIEEMIKCVKRARK
eukprot:scaffold19838_cov130-Skeletonema_dohrnii-CCMP3373.AAC.2